jgi:hypothetical protein
MQSYRAGYRARLKTANAGNRGSVLVGAVVLCTLMAIGVAGLMGVARNTVNQEVDAFDNEQALLAAESGLMIGTYQFKQGNGNDFDYDFPTQTGKIRVSILKTQVNPDDEDIVSLVSRANHPNLSYYKELSAELRNNRTPSGYYGYFVDMPIPTTGTYDGLRAPAGGFRMPMHFNGPLKLESITAQVGSNVRPIFYDLVSVFNPKTTPGTDGRTYANFAYGRGAKGDYNHGIMLNQQMYDGNRAADIDPSFQERGKFKAIKDSLMIMFDHTIPMDDGSFATKITLPPLPSGTKRGTLEFRDDASRIYFNNQPLSSHGAAYTLPPVGTAVVLESNYPLTIKRTNSTGSGTIVGVITVRTTVPRSVEGGNAIHIDLINGNSGPRSLLYKGMSQTSPYNINDIPKGSTPNNDIDREYCRNCSKSYRLDKSNTNLLGLYTDYGDVVVESNNTSTTTVIAAQIFAPGPGGKIRFTNSNTNNRLRVIGVCVSKEWWNYKNDASVNDFTVLYDHRALGAAGVHYSDSQGGSGTITGAGEGRITMSRWMERNVPKQRI